jgi:hypothetical protein
MGLQMSMGLGGNAGTYAGPVFGSDGPAAVPSTGGYADTRGGSAMTFGPGGAGGERNPAVHALGFGVVCFAVLIFMAWALPR